MNIYRIFFTAFLALGLSAQALAESVLLADKSEVRFISVKNAAIAEVHHFKSLSGTIGENRVEVTIPLDGVETMIPIRNERMREMLFETMLYPEATLSGNIDTDALMALENGDYTSMDVNLVLRLHDNNKSVNTTVSVARLGDEFHVSTEQPIVLDASDFDLVAGIERLREVAGLKNIATQIPVTATLVFSR